LTAIQRRETVPDERKERRVFMHFRQRAVVAVDALLAQLPAGDPERRTVPARAHGYYRACGCAMGGAFLTTALVLTIVYFATIGDFGWRSATAGVVFILLGSALGKAAGVLLAWARLALLRRSLARRLERTGVAHVHMH
jgi:hypothetical protein